MFQSERNTRRGRWRDMPEWAEYPAGDTRCAGRSPMVGWLSSLLMRRGPHFGKDGRFFLQGRGGPQG